MFLLNLISHIESERKHIFSYCFKLTLLANQTIEEWAYNIV